MMIKIDELDINLKGSDSVGRVVIWNMLPVLQEREEDIEIPKILCQLDHHNGNSIYSKHK